MITVDAATYAALSDEAAWVGLNGTSLEEHVTKLLRARAADFRRIQRGIKIPDGEVDDVDTFAGLWRGKGIDGVDYQETVRTEWYQNRGG